MGQGTPITSQKGGYGGAPGRKRDMIAAGEAIVVSDDEVSPIPIGDRGLGGHIAVGPRRPRPVP